MEGQTGRANRTVRVSARLTPFEVARLDAIAQLRQVSRSEALREAIAWLAAREAVWAERARQARIRRVVDESESWDPTGDHLSAGAP
jgi:predicted transcriptional regulator